MGTVFGMGGIKPVEDGLAPAAFGFTRRRQAEDDALIIFAAALSSTVECAGFVEDESGVRSAAAGGAVKAIEDLLGPVAAGMSGRRQLIDNAAAVTSIAIAAVVRGAVQIAGAVENYIGPWRFAVEAAKECVESGESPGSTGLGGRRELEDDATATQGTIVRGELAADLCGAVQIASAVEGQAGRWLRAVGAAGKVVEDGFGIGLAGVP